MKRYAVLLLAALAVAALALRFAPRESSTSADAAPAPAGPAVAVEIEITGAGALSPARVTVPLGGRVALRIVNRGPMAARVALMGYEDRLGAADVAPGATWQGSFVADRPGDDFAWTLDGAPAGRLRVSGSHLIEGHR